MQNIRCHLFIGKSFKTTNQNVRGGDCIGTSITWSPSWPPRDPTPWLVDVANWSTFETLFSQGMGLFYTGSDGMCRKVGLQRMFLAHTVSKAFATLRKTAPFRRLAESRCVPMGERNEYCSSRGIRRQACKVTCVFIFLGVNKTRGRTRSLCGWSVQVRKAGHRITNKRSHRIIKQESVWTSLYRGAVSGLQNKKKYWLEY